MELTTILLTGIAGLATTVTILFKIVMKQTKDQLSMAREQTSQAKEQGKLKERIGKVEGEHKGIIELSEKTLQAVREAVANKENPN